MHFEILSSVYKHTSVAR